MGARNFGMHLKDHDNDKQDRRGLRQGPSRRAGGPQGPARSEVQGLHRIEYEANPNEPTADVKACVDVFKEAVKKLA